MRSALPLLALLALSLTSPGAGRRLEVLFLGDNGHHQPAERFYEMLQGMTPRGVNVTYTDKLEDLNAANLARYDALAIYANIDNITPAAEQALLGYVRGGKGLVAIHCASYCFRNSPAYVQLVGAQFKSHGTGDFKTTITAPTNPVMQGFTGFETWDETYVHAQPGTDRIVLQTREGEPYTWLRKEGAGRVFYTAYGHDHRTWKNPGFQELLYRGIRYAVGDPVAKELDALALQPARYTDNPASPIPNYEKRNPAPKLQEPFSPAEAAKHIAVPADLTLTLFCLGKGRPLERDRPEVR